MQIRREAPKTWKKCLTRSSRPNADVEELRAETTFVRNNETQDVIESEKLIESHKFGTDLVSVSGKAFLRF